MSENLLKIYSTGEGPTLLFLHGLGSSRRCWDLVIHQLKSEYHCCTVELYGHGSQPPLPGRTTIEGTAEDLNSMLKTVKWQPDIIIGHSLGGLVAASLALQNSACARQLILLDTPTRQVRLKFLHRLTLSALRKHFQQSITKQVQRMTRDTELQEELIQTNLSTDHASYLQYMESLLKSDYTSRIREISLPLEAWITRSLAPDKLTLEKVLQQYGYDHLSPEQVRHMPDAGHFVMLERPEQVASLLSS